MHYFSIILFYLLIHLKKREQMVIFVDRDNERDWICPIKTGFFKGTYSVFFLNWILNGEVLLYQNTS